MSRRMSRRVPDDIFPNILSRLPATSLLRFRCVCKSWKGLIESPGFINDQLIHSRRINSSNSNLNKYIIIQTNAFTPAGASDSIKRGFLRSEDLEFLSKKLWAYFTQLSHPLESHKTEILGSCDGLLVLSKGEDDIILWNPSITRFKIIPAPGIDFPMHTDSFIVYGFGYDSLSNDHKLVRIVQSCGPNTPGTSQVKVFSVKHDSWKQIAVFPYHLKVTRGNGVFVDGALHWIVGTTRVMNSEDDGGDCLVGAFDLETEDYRLVSLPEFATDDEFQIKNLGALGGCLTVVCYQYPNDVGVWVMKEYGVEESWSLLFTFSLSCVNDVCYGIDSDDVVMPIAYSDCGRKVLVGFGRGVLLWYDLDRKSFDKTVVENVYDIKYDEHFEVHTCLKSLVLLDNGIRDCDFDVFTKNDQEKNESPTLRNDFLYSWFSQDDDEY